MNILLLLLYVLVLSAGACTSFVSLKSISRVKKFTQFPNKMLILVIIATYLAQFIPLLGLGLIAEMNMSFDDRWLFFFLPFVVNGFAAIYGFDASKEKNSATDIK